jgi:hypothetical protein
MPWVRRKWSPYTGLSAASTAGLAAIWAAPATAMTKNQTVVMGANQVETRAVPCDCTENSATRITTVIGST